MKNFLLTKMTGPLHNGWLLITWITIPEHTCFSIKTLEVKCSRRIYICARLYARAVINWVAMGQRPQPPLRGKMGWFRFPHTSGKLVDSRCLSEYAKRAVFPRNTARRGNRKTMKWFGQGYWIRLFLEPIYNLLYRSVLYFNQIFIDYFFAPRQYLYLVS